MTPPCHHPSDSTIQSYAAGALDPASTIVVKHHLDLCPAHTDVVRFAETLGGILLAELPGADTPPEALEDVLRRLDQPPRAAARPPMRLDLRPVGLRWAAPSPTIKYRRLWRQGQNALQLVQLAPGATAPMHGHNGLELMLVLSGCFTDGRDDYGPGDVCEADETVHHEPRTVGPAPCLCLIALEGKLLYRSWLHRVRQRVFGL